MKIMKCFYLSLDLIHVYNDTKFYQNLYICSRDIEQNAISKHQSRAITLELSDKIFPSAIPKHILPTSTLMQSLKKIRKKMAKIESKTNF